MRKAIEFIKENLKGNLIGVEIGVYQGVNAENMLKNIPIKKIYLIDPYEIYEDYSDQPTPLLKAEPMANNRLFEYKDKIIWIKKKASDAIHLIPINLDFVYIDGNHKYEYVKKDIENFYPKLKIGGILAGHDFKARPYEPGIEKAVEEFAEKKKLKLYSKKDDWWVVKEC